MRLTRQKGWKWMTSQREIINFAVGLAVFWTITYITSRVLRLEKYGLTVQPAYIRYESSRFRRLLYKASERGRGLWKTYSNLGIALAAGQMVYAVYFLLDNLARFIQPGGGPSPVLPILPGITVRTYWLPYLLFAVAIAIITHEAAHGIVARTEGIPIKSAGAILLLALPGGFVEPDEEKFENSSTTSKLRVLAAGSSINLLTGLLALLLLSTLFSRASSGAVMIETVEGGPLDAAGIQRWDVIYAVNSTPVRSVWELAKYLDGASPGDPILLSTSRGDILIILGEASGEGVERVWSMLGAAPPFMNYHESRLGLGSSLNIHLYLTLYWSFTVFLSIAVMNMLPLYPFDGERFLYTLLRRFTGSERWLQIAINVFSLCLIAANMIMSFMRNLILI